MQSQSKKPIRKAQVAPSVDECINKIVADMLARRPKHRIAVARPERNGKVIPNIRLREYGGGHMPSEAATMVFGRNHLDEKVADSIRKCIKLESRPDLEWDMRITGFDKPAPGLPRIKSRKPHLNTGRNRKRHHESLPRLVGEKGASLPVHMVGNNRRLKCKDRY